MDTAAPFILRPAGAWVAVALVFVLSCSAPAAAPPPRPAPTPVDPAEQMIRELTTILKLDAVQQQKTRQLVGDMIAREDKIRAGWAAGQRVQPEKITASRNEFEAALQAILTEEQRRLLAENRLRFLKDTRGVRSP